MLKRLPILCAALLALAACSHDSDTGGTTPAGPTAAATTPVPAAAATTSPATPATTPSPAAAGSATPDAAATTVQTTAPASNAPPPAPFVDNGKWVEGKNYFVIEPAQATSHPGKIEVTEVFSYACPACNQFHTTADEIARTLPAGAVMNYLPASFRPDENWPLFQRAFYTAQALGVVDKTHDAMFDAIWVSGELATDNLKTGRLKPKEAWPTIDDVAKFYAKYGADPKEFTGIANSFTINTKMKQADDLIKAYSVASTPGIVIDGKYRLDPISAGGYPQTMELVQWLVSKEAAGK